MRKLSAVTCGLCHSAVFHAVGHRICMWFSIWLPCEMKEGDCLNASNPFVCVERLFVLFRPFLFFFQSMFGCGLWSWHTLYLLSLSVCPFRKHSRFMSGRYKSVVHVYVLHNSNRLGYRIPPWNFIGICFCLDQRVTSHFHSFKVMSLWLHFYVTWAKCSRVVHRSSIRRPTPSIFDQ